MQMQSLPVCFRFDQIKNITGSASKLVMQVNVT